MLTSVFPVALDAPGRLALMPRPRGDDWLENEVRGLRASGIDLIVSLLERAEAEELGLAREADACASAGVEFRSFPIPDRDVPPLDAMTRAFIEGVRDAVADGASTVIHCRMGIGRSSLIAAAVLQRFGVSAEDALDRLTRARGLPVPDTEAQRAWILAFRRESIVDFGR